MQVVLATDRAGYTSGAPISLNLTIRNTGTGPATLRFSSGQRYDFSIRDAAGSIVWTWSADRSFIQALGEEQIGPGEALTFGETFAGTLPPGRYTVRGTVPVLDGVLADTAGFEVR